MNIVPKARALKAIKTVSDFLLNNGAAGFVVDGIVLVGLSTELPIETEAEVILLLEATVEKLKESQK